MSKMNWERLLSGKRLGKLNQPVELGGARTPFQRDFDRILFSSAFRRLQDKTQVFPLAKDDYVRTRLTHSLEVSSVGRSLGVMVGDEIIKRNPNLQSIGITAADFGTIVAAAGLAHDIGNPPFGHAGESAIQHWFRSQTADSKFLSGRGLDDVHRADLQCFEGNAQGFRLLTKTETPDQPGGMQLTAAVLGSFVKYPRLSVASEQAAAGVSGKKFGFVAEDFPRFEEIAKELGLIQKAENAWYRHPLAFLMEAADDICYRVMDVEDGFRTGYLSFSEVQPLFASILTGTDMARAQTIPLDKHRIEFFRAKAIHIAIEEVVVAFLEREDRILSGTFDDDLMNHIPRADAYREFKTLARKKVYSAAPVVEIEACGFKVIGGLLDVFLNAIDDYASHGRECSLMSTTILKLMPEPPSEGMAFYSRVLAVTDFVSGMADSYALRTYQRIHGISLP